MAKKTKDPEIELKTNKKVSAKKPDLKMSNEKSTSVKKSATKKSTVENISTKKPSIRKTSAEKGTTKKASTKKSTTTRATVKRNSTSSTKKSTVTKSDEKLLFQSEYYDLPYGYNKTVVKILAQTPTTLFVYWELSEDDRNMLKQTYGENFFEVTKPILILYNDTLNYAFEIEINDFANSWYIHVNDSKCNYRIELGRKPIHNANTSDGQLSSLDIENQNYNDSTNTASSNSSVQKNSIYIPYYVYITSSNKMIAPNDRILFKNISKVTFRNIKTGEIKERDFKEFKFITNYGIMNLTEIYKYLYPNEDFSYEKFLKNPSSGGLSSSRSFSSQFK